MCIIHIKILILFSGKQPVAETPIGCNKSITLQNSSDTFLLQSPDHPNTYPNFMDCFIFIQAPEYHSIIFEFAEFNLESDERFVKIMHNKALIFYIFSCLTPDYRCNNTYSF